LDNSLASQIGFGHLKRRVSEIESLGPHSIDLAYTNFTKASITQYQSISGLGYHDYLSGASPKRYRRGSKRPKHIYNNYRAFSALSPFQQTINYNLHIVYSAYYQ
jgi:hypothetical protein